MRTTLTITPTPFRSSHLTIPPSPFSPKPPLPPLPQKPTQPKPPTPKIPLALPPPPPQPLKWLWQCHQCARVYHLGTTRRCLDDGHYFCAGAPVTKRDRKTGIKITRKSRACASEFDYQGWKSWGVWRRDVHEQREAAEALAGFGVGEEEGVVRIEDVEEVAVVVPRPLFSRPLPGVLMPGFGVRVAEEKDCWNECDYPSECRWGKQFGQQQTQQQQQHATVIPPSTPPPPPPPPPPPASMINEPTAQDLAKPSKTFSSLTSSLPSTIEEVTEPDPEPPTTTSTTTTTTLQETTKKPTFDDLLASAKRRKRRSAGPPPSPLASNPPSPTDQEGSSASSDPADLVSGSAHTTLQRAFDDFELDVRKGIGRAGSLIHGFVGGLNLKGGGVGEEERRAEAFVVGGSGRGGHGRKKNGGKEGEEGQSLSD